MKHIKKINEKEYRYILYVLGVFIIHLCINATNDDIYKMNLFSEMSLKDVWDYTLNICNSVSRRYITYFIGNTILYVKHGFFLWRVLDSLVIYILLKSISYIFISNKNIDKLLLLLVAMYPIKDMVTAGAVSTTVGYLWPLTFGLLSFAIMKKQSNEELRFCDIIIFVFGVIYGADQEQMCIVQILIYGYILMKSIYQKKLNILAILGTIISLAYFMLHISLGASARTEFEISDYFPDFNTLSFVDKVEMAFSPTMDRIIYDYGIFFILSFVLWICVWKSTKDGVLRTCSLIPIFCILVGNTNIKWLQTVKYVINTDVGQNVKFGAISVDNYTKVVSYIPLFLFCAIALLTLLNIYISNDNKINAYELIGLIVVGMISRMALCITPNIYASGDRTYLFLFFAIIVVIVKCVDCNIGKLSEVFYNRTIKSLVRYSLPILTVCFFLNNSFELLAMVQ